MREWKSSLKTPEVYDENKVLFNFDHNHANMEELGTVNDIRSSGSRSDFFAGVCCKAYQISKRIRLTKTIFTHSTEVINIQLRFVFQHFSFVCQNNFSRLNTQ